MPSTGFLPSKMYPERKKSTVEVDWETGRYLRPCEQKEGERYTVQFLLPSVQAGVNLTIESRVYSN
jgi:hypothetical protein